MGRTLRYANRHQRRALLARDGGCIFPGCDRPASWCDAHHVDEWDNNGPTDINNLGLLCRHHHRVTHRPGWTMTRTAQPPTTQSNDPNTRRPRPGQIPMANTHRTSHRLPTTPPAQPPDSGVREYSTQPGTAMPSPVGNIR
ncbi:MAG: HNH endonuclease [Candidatus Microthrix sp.]|nr:HNH endonuclease [Candidatus Microthrix sp.]